jgi:hypothetical protein
MRKLALLISIFITLTSAQEIGAHYLIITPPDFYDIVLPLAEWKTMKGLKTRVATTIETGTQQEDIKNYVTNAYNTWSIRPQYLLLVGGHAEIPFPSLSYQGVLFRSDNYYTDVEGDFHNEILPGRLYVTDTLEAKTVISKVLDYDKEPYLADLLWFRKGVTIVNEYEQGQPPSDSLYWEDARYAHQLMLNAGFVHIDSFSYNYGHTGADVINAINDGRSYILYRGIGFSDWLAPFDEIYTEQMNNGFKLPIVVSATCGTILGIGKDWQSAGTPAEPKGVVGLIGTTTALFGAAEFRSALARGTFDGFFCDSLGTLGKATEAGRLKYYDEFNDSLDYGGWNCLGDPEMTVWTSTPKDLQVSHSPVAWLGATLSVHVSHNSLPVERALVCVMAKDDSTVYHRARTDYNGNAIFIDTLYFPDSALITVTGRNLLPRVDTVAGGNYGGPCVIYRHHMVLDTLNGNGNLQPNNGEEIDLAVWVINTGDSTAYNVVGTLQKAQPDDYYQLSDTIKYFSDIASLDSAFTSADGFNIAIHPDCPDSHQIELKLTLHDVTDSTWTSFISLTVYSPRPYVIYKSHLVLDSIGGNANFQINPGEDIELAVWVQNIGDSIAENVHGILQQQEPDPLFSLSDTMKYFGNILPLDSAWTTSDGYNVWVDSACPDLYEIELRLKITDSLDSVWTYDFILTNHAPEIVFHDYFFHDSLKYILPGDTASLTILLRNAGTFVGENVNGTLFCDDTLLTVINGSADFGDIHPDSIGINQPDFLITASSTTLPCYVTNLGLAVSAGVYQDTVDSEAYVGQHDYLIWDPDPNHSSGFVIHTKLTQLSFIGDYQHTFPLGYLNVYKSLFACLGMYPDNYIILDTSTVIPEIEHFLSVGGKMYLEGGDVWFNDPASGGYDFCSLFDISPITNNIGYFTGLLGVDNTFTQGMSFTYGGENSSIDRIDPTGSGLSIFTNAFNGFGCGVAANQKTVGISIELGGLVDSVVPSTKLVLIDSILQYFNIPASGINERQMSQASLIPSLSVYPNPCLKTVGIRLNVPTGSNLSLKVYDILGRCVRTLCDKQTIAPARTGGDGESKTGQNWVWDGRDNIGRKVSRGVYFVRLETDDSEKAVKIVLLR